MLVSRRSLYDCTHARFHHARLLTEDEMRAPSIFAVTAHESRSERFQPIPIIEILRELAKEGFSVVPVNQSGARDASRRDNTKQAQTNTVQENCIYGSLHSRYRNVNNQTRRASMREVKGIDQNTKLNQALWHLANKMAELKGAH